MSEIDILFVDGHVVVVNKPSGLLVHRGWANDDDVAMFRVRDALGAHVYPVHRLDRGTSGALVFARTKEAAATLSEQFESRQVDKRISPSSGARRPTPEQSITRFPRAETARASPPSRTSLWSRARTSIAAADAGDPGDGPRAPIRRPLSPHRASPRGRRQLRLRGINRRYRAAYALHRLALHAHAVAFNHPVSGARLALTAPMPDDLGLALERLELPRVPLDIRDS